ncbi:hypothetical protein [Botrimarina mediterranea]|uniref:Uncharacterized protein n=1 Tax=Botrimarina mediterranea TaxID=2528022 RepID=A0A518K4J7_9BACT|nr:hypothetical protein [Botrimarina mediterranea]QDV72719.1 hypothetical protein Spa11_09010 [Botrimarina mediterranea]QDV77292.1 hypothetical protein K2D_08830 [Planctomycetes bacterium K2D]
MNAPETPSPAGPDEATLLVAQAGQAAAAAAGLECVLELSPHSESRYLHVLRGDAWYGIRVSCHEAVYDCCRDYTQLRVGEPPTPEVVAAASAAAEQLVLSGGEVVADPAAVAVAIDKIAAVLCDGRTYRDDDGLRWRWVADEERWDLACRYWGDESVLTPPTHRPSTVVTARIRCQVRHTQNVTARWAAEAGSESDSK